MYDKAETERNIRTVLSRISALSREVRVVAATKTVPADRVEFARDCGVTDAGENRVQEFVGKKDGVSGVDWHFIGTLQTNKAKYLVGNVKLIQSVNSAALAAEIDRLAQKRGVVQDVLMEVNVAGEHSKTGAAIDTAFMLAQAIDGLKNVRLCGLMSVPPIDAEDETYRRIRDLYERLKVGRRDFTVLSVGMSDDYERAIGFGSNMVRIGRAFFGDRNRDGVHKDEL